MSGIGNVIDEEAIGNGRVVSVIADDPFFSPLKFFEGRPAYDFDFALEVARRDYNRRATGKTPHAGGQDISARLLGDKASIRVNHRARTVDGPMRGKLIRRRSPGCEANDIAGARGGRAAGN